MIISLFHTRAHTACTSCPPRRTVHPRPVSGEHTWGMPPCNVWDARRLPPNRAGPWAGPDRHLKIDIGMCARARAHAPGVHVMPAAPMAYHTHVHSVGGTKHGACPHTTSGTPGVYPLTVPAPASKSTPTRVHTRAHTVCMSCPPRRWRSIHPHTVSGGPNMGHAPTQRLGRPVSTP